ncbi:hypothetical protein JTB14_017343 [Gonioctena quinquepunctata]|nr:hypothetical protein JTB14_017343 [Gonioctena quinquepunctata]
MELIEEWFIHLGIILLSPKKTQNVVNSLKSLLKTCNQVHECHELIDLSGVAASSQNLIVDKKALYENSKFYQYFKLIKDQLHDLIKNDTGIGKNIYYNEKFYEIIKKKYFTYLPLWTALLNKDSGCTRFSNAPVENWFSVVKHLIINTNNLQRCSRIIRLIRKRVLSYYKEITLGIPKEQCTSRKRKLTSQIIHDELTQTEEWSKKMKPNQNNFSHTYLNKLSNKIMNDKFGKTSTLKEVCKNFLSNLSMTQEDQLLLEEITRNQRLSPKWFEERRKRLTASNWRCVQVEDRKK